MTRRLWIIAAVVSSLATYGHLWLMSWVLFDVMDDYHWSHLPASLSLGSVLFGLMFVSLYCWVSVGDKS